MDSIEDVSKRLLKQADKNVTSQGVSRDFQEESTPNNLESPQMAKKPSQEEYRLCDDTCEICRGIGWLRLDKQPWEKGFGDMVPCHNSAKYVFAKKSGLEPEEWYASWGSVADINNAGDAVDAVRRVIQRGHGWVYLWGKPGLAKTLILKIAVAESIRLGRETNYVRMVEIIDSLKKSFEQKGSWGEDIRRLEKWSDVPALAIDEFDRIQATEWADNRRFLLLDKRYSDACLRRSLTIFASNADPKGFEDYLSSRIHDGRFFVVKLSGMDVRPRME